MSVARFMSRLLMRPKVSGAILMVACLSMSNPASAQQGGQWWGGAFCNLSSNTLNLGTADPHTHTDTTHDINFVCSFSFAYPFEDDRVTFRLCLYMNDEAGGYSPWRHLDNASWWPPHMPNPPTPEFLAYNLYADGARTHILAPPAAGPAMVSQVLTINRGFPYQPVSASGSFSVHARIPVFQPGLAAGNYESSPNFMLRYSVAAGSVPPSDCEQSTSSRAIRIQATVPDSCTLNAQAVDFGLIDQVGVIHSALHAEGLLNVRCSAGRPYTVYLGDGNHPNGTQRNMANGSSRLAYLLFQDSARVLPWTDSSGVSRVGTGNEQNLVVYGQIPVGTTVPGQLGTYTDTVIVTVSY